MEKHLLDIEAHSGLGPVTLDVSRERATMETDLQFSHLSAEARVIHGADTMIPLIRVCEDLLTDGETISVLHKVRWHKPNSRNLVLQASLHKPDASAAVITAEIKTSQQRTLYVTGTPSQPVKNPLQPTRNYYAATIMATAEINPVPVSLRQAVIEFGEVPIEPEALSSGGLRAAIIMELILNAIKTTDQFYSLNGGLPVSIGGLKNTSLPQPDSLVGTQNQFRLNLGTPRGLLFPQVHFDLATPNGTVLNEGQAQIRFLHPEETAAFIAAANA